MTFHHKPLIKPPLGLLRNMYHLGSLASSFVWHPNTQMGEWSGFDKIVRADGMWLVDSKGYRMLDGVASMWCNVWGHSDADMIRAISRQASRLQHSPMFNLTNEPAEDLASRLVGISPGMHKVFFSDNGSTAMEIAFKMALQYWRNSGRPEKNKIASLKNGYHGDTFGAMSVGYVPEFFKGFKPHLFRTLQIPAPDSYHDTSGADSRGIANACLEHIEELFARDDNIAAFVMESGAQMAAGAIIFPKGFQSRVKRLCKRYDILLVLDEVATGFGRLGPMIQYTEQGGAPDIVSYGKMLTGGYITMAATLATKKVYDSFLGSYDDGVHLFHGHTYTGNPIAAAAAIENLKLYKRRGLIRKIASTSKILSGYIPEIAAIDIVGDVRYKGMLMGIELVSDRAKKTPVTCERSLNSIIFKAGRRNGIYLRTLGNIVMLVPPLAISKEELDMLINRTIKTINDVKNKLTHAPNMVNN